MTRQPYVSFAAPCESVRGCAKGQLSDSMTSSVLGEREWENFNSVRGSSPLCLQRFAISALRFKVPTHLLSAGSHSRSIDSLHPRQTPAASFLPPNRKRLAPTTRRPCASCASRFRSQLTVIRPEPQKTDARSHFLVRPSGREGLRLSPGRPHKTRSER